MTVQGGSHCRSEYQAVILPKWPGAQPGRCLINLVSLESVYGKLGKRQSPPGFLSLSIPVSAHGAPYRDSPGFQVQVIPCKRPGLLRANACHEAQDNVSVKLGIPGSLEKCCGLLWSQGLG